MRDISEIICTTIAGIILLYSGFTTFWDLDRSVNVVATTDDSVFITNLIGGILVVLAIVQLMLGTYLLTVEVAHLIDSRRVSTHELRMYRAVRYIQCVWRWREHNRYKPGGSGWAFAKNEFTNNNLCLP